MDKVRRGVVYEELFTNGYTEAFGLIDPIMRTTKPFNALVLLLEVYFICIKKFPFKMFL